MSIKDSSWYTSVSGEFLLAINNDECGGAESECEKINNKYDNEVNKYEHNEGHEISSLSRDDEMWKHPNSLHVYTPCDTNINPSILNFKCVRWKYLFGLHTLCNAVWHLDEFYHCNLFVLFIRLYYTISERINPRSALMAKRTAWK